MAQSLLFSQLGTVLMAILENQTRRQKKQAHLKVEDAHRLNKQLQRKREQQLLMMKAFSAGIGKQKKEEIQQHETRITEVKKPLNGLHAETAVCSSGALTTRS